MKNETISLQDFKKLENKTELSFPITIGVLSSKNRLNFWQSKAFSYSIFSLHIVLYSIFYHVFYKPCFL